MIENASQSIVGVVNKQKSQGIHWKATSLIPTIYLMEESESYRYYCERKESKQEIELYIFEVLKKHIPITYYI